jgi:two-component system cell cycle response regulator DivK
MARILVIDDDAIMRRLVSALLEKMGHTVCTAADGEAGLREVGSVSPQLIILDMNMPKPDGYEVARRLKRDAVLRRIPILALTGQIAIEDYQKARAAGCDGFLAKPVDAERLRLKLDLMLMTRADRQGLGAE